MFDNNSKEMEKKLPPYEQNKYYSPTKPPKQQQSWQDRTKKDLQPANIGPQDVPRTSPTNVPRTSPKDPI